MSEGQMLHESPYVEQIEKYADSLQRLSQTFLHLEKKKDAFSNEEVEAMFSRVRDKVCGRCEKCDWCWGENFIHTYQMGYDVLSAVDRYGNELNTEVKRRLMQQCEKGPRFLREMLAGFHEARQNIIWVNRMARSRECCAIQLDTFADMIRSSARELENSIFSDDRLKKKLEGALRKKGLRVLALRFFMNPEGRYEIHVTARMLGGQTLAAKEVVRTVAEAAGRSFVLPGGSTGTVGPEYVTVVCREGAAFYTMQGMAKIGKGCSRISGDNFALLDLQGGRQAAILSDGMGAGEDACRESTMVIELLEELLKLDELEELWLSEWDSLPLSEEEVPSLIEEEVPSLIEEDSSSFEEEAADVTSPSPHPARTRAAAARMRAYVFLSFMVGDSFPYSAGVHA